LRFLVGKCFLGANKPLLDYFNHPFKMKLLLALTVATLRIASFSSYAGQPHPIPVHYPIVFTQDSDTDLTASLDGIAYGTIINLAPHHWAWSFPFITKGFYQDGTPPAGNTWQEPENASTINVIEPSVRSDQVGFLDIRSEVDPGTLEWVFGAPPLPSGAYGFSIGPIQEDFYMGDLYDLYFVDNSNVVTSPDAGPTYLLLLGPAIAGAVLKRRS
jgi:hypothetical protein